MANRIEVQRELEWRACRASLLYFVQNYWKVLDLENPSDQAGYSAMDTFDYQDEELVRWQEACEGKRRSHQMRLKARQLGWTTLAGAGAFWDAFFHPHHPWLIAAQGEDDAAKTLLTKVKVPYNMLPAWMRDRGPQVETWNNETVSFENGSSILSIPSTSSSGRGQAIFGALMDEAAFMENADELFAAIEPMTYGPLFLWSTANGMGNFFHETWTDSQLPDSEWEGHFYPWDARPGRDQAWYDRKKRLYRTKLHLFYQEFPSSPEEAFTRSGRVALPVEHMRDEHHWCPPIARYDLLGLRDKWDKDFTRGEWAALFRSAELIGDNEADLELHLWAEPEVERGEHGEALRDPNYTVAVDVAEGLEHGDYSAINVLDINGLEQVATVRAHVPLEDLAGYAEMLGYWYFNALVGVERNNAGVYPLAQLQERAYPRLYRMDTLAQQKRGDRTARYGWYTSRATKPYLVTNFTQYVMGPIVLHDKRLLNEATVFLSDGKGGFGAQGTNHDDLIMAVMISFALAEEVGRYPTIFYDPDPGPATFAEVFQLMAAEEDGRTDGKPKEYGRALAGGIGQQEKDPARVVKSFEMSG